MKFKLKQPTKYMHENLQHEDSDIQEQQNEKNEPNSKQQDNSNVASTSYKRKKIIKKKNEPSAVRLSKINQTFQKIYHNSSKLFQDLNVDVQKLNTLSETKIKEKCFCNKNVKFYCLKCMQKVTNQSFPSIELPFEVSIIHHESEKINKSSALPLKFMTKQVKIHLFSSLDEGKNVKLWQDLPKPGHGVYILFPHKQSKIVEQVFEQAEKGGIVPVSHLIILDCTWFQTDQILEIMKEKGYNQYVRISGYRSLYWRYNHHNDEALSSAEAIAFFMREYQKSLIKQQSKQNTVGQQNEQKEVKKYDNLLFLYCLNLKMILKDEQRRIDWQLQNQSKINEKV